MYNDDMVHALVATDDCQKLLTPLEKLLKEGRPMSDLAVDVPETDELCRGSPVWLCLLERATPRRKETHVINPMKLHACRLMYVMIVLPNGRRASKGVIAKMVARMAAA